MTEDSFDDVRKAIVTRYAEFKARLARALGSLDMAEEALQEAYLRLHEREGGGIAKPDSFVFRIALNIAADIKRSDRRRQGQANALAEVSATAPAPDLADEIEMRSLIRALEKAVEALPERRRAIFLAARVEEAPLAEIAARFGLSKTMVQRELRAALDHCIDWLEKNGDGVA
jgi:RNA polymerase sigma-70 factor (ECF subfamily)